MPPFNLLYNLFLPSFLYSFAVSREIPINSATSEILYPFNVNDITFPHCGGNCSMVVKIRANTSSSIIRYKNTYCFSPSSNIFISYCLLIFK